MDQTLQCLNCTSILEQQDSFCRACGQKTVVHRFTLKKILHEFFHAFTHTDRSIFHLLRGLATRPGIIALEYLQGRRKKYFNPFTFFVLCMGFFVLSNNLFQAYGQAPDPDPQVLQSMPDESARHKYRTIVQRQGEISIFLQKNTNILTMVAVPFFSLMSWGLLRRKRLNYAEHLVANVLFISFSNLIFTIIALPLMGYTAGTQTYFIILFTALLLQSIYMAWAHYQLQEADRNVYFVKTLGLSLLWILLWNLVTMLITIAYIFRSGFFNALGNMLGLS